MPQFSPSIEIEQSLFSKGFSSLAGIDEAGRGCLAGPVTAGAVCIREKHLARFLKAGIKDSKILTAKRRETLYGFLTRSFPWAVGESSHREIDQLGIKKATILAMARAARALPVSPEFILIDGRWTIGDIEGGSPLSAIAISKRGVVRGDQRCLSVAAASIVAKVWRDNIMRRYHRQYPLFDFFQHKGYGTRKHLAALARHGPCPIHRLSFAPLKKKSREAAEK